MEGFELTIEQQRALRAAHGRIRDKRPADRIKAVLLLGTGWTAAQVAEALLLDESTSRRFVERYRQGGVEGLLKMDYRGSEPRLDEAQRTQLDAHLSQTIYLRVADIVAYIKNSFGVAYSVQGLTDLLHRMGYSYKKPKVVPGNRPSNSSSNWRPNTPTRARSTSCATTPGTTAATWSTRS